MFSLSRRYSLPPFLSLSPEVQSLTHVLRVKRVALEVVEAVFSLLSSAQDKFLLVMIVRALSHFALCTICEGTIFHPFSHSEKQRTVSLYPRVTELRSFIQLLKM